jgi:nitrogen fixation NifU-like protein
VRYSEALVDHFLNPRNAGLMRDPDGRGEDEYEGCGDLTRFYLRVREGRALEVRFQTYGCGPTIAAASAASELARGRPVEDLVAVKAGDVEAALGGLPDDRRHAADVAAGALRAAALDYLGRHDGRPAEGAGRDVRV